MTAKEKPVRAKRLANQKHVAAKSTAAKKSRNLLRLSKAARENGNDCDLRQMFGPEMAEAHGLTKKKT